MNSSMTAGGDEEHSSRQVTLIVHPSRERLGPYAIEEPRWPETESIVAAALADTGRRFVVLRVISVTADRHGGQVTYLVEDVHAAGTPEEVDHGRRMSWARPGAALDDVAWATTQLSTTQVTGTQVAGDISATQVKTWNLSSVWRFETQEPNPSPGPDPRLTVAAWLKVAPPFLGHEGRLTAWLSAQGHPVPLVKATDGNRTLFDHVDGLEGHDASTEHKLAMMQSLVAIQVDCSTLVAELLALGVPDWRAEPLRDMADDLISRREDELTSEEKQRLTRLLDSIGERFETAHEAGIADSLVHGDAHPSNARFGENPLSLTILDWGDATLGCPILDVPRMAEIADQWLRQWAEAVPGSDPWLAWEAVKPLAALREAVTYQRFLDLTEPSEHVYHRFDVLPPLAEAAALST